MSVNKTLTALWQLRGSRDEETSDVAFLAINTVKRQQEKIEKYEKAIGAIANIDTLFLLPNGDEREWNDKEALQEIERLAKPIWEEIANQGHVHPSDNDWKDIEGSLMKYAVGVCPHDEDNEVKFVEATNELEAMVKAVGEEESWGFSKGEIPFDTVDEGIDFYLQGDLSLSKPIAL